MPLNTEDALRFAMRLQTVKDFPRNDEALLATQEDLQELVKNVPDKAAYERIDWLVHHIRHKWDEGWNQAGGTAAMIELYCREFLSLPQVPSLEEQFGPKPELDCGMCRDTAVVQDSATGQYSWCTCEFAEQQKRNYPDFLKLCQPRQASKVLTMPPAPKVEKWRCVDCHDTGVIRLAGEFDGYEWCSCEYAHEVRMRYPAHVEELNQYQSRKMQ